MNSNLPAPPDTLRQQLVRMTPEFQKALPGHIPAERFVRTVQTAIQMNPAVAKAATGSKGGMQSLFAACTKAATDGLILDGREAALVTFRQKTPSGNYEDRIQYLPMVAGLMKKARNSGEISSIAAHVVYENDHFEYVLGDDEKIIHTPMLRGDRGAPIAVYAIVRLKDGSVQREVMDRAAVMRIAAQSKNADQYDPNKGKNFGEWWRKTIIRRISKYLPSSSDRDDFQRAVERIDETFDFDGEAGASETSPEPRPATKRRGAAAAALKDVTPPKEEQEQEPKPEREGTPHDPVTGEVLDMEPEDPQPGDDI